MPYRAYKYVVEWDTKEAHSISGKPFNVIYEQIQFLNKTHYFQYVPTLSSKHQDFLARLSEWLENVNNDKDRQILLELVPSINFFGRDDFLKLQQTAFRGPITRWMIDHLNLRFDDPNLESKVSQELCFHTWYCPITDSMQISDFCHANNLGGVDYRPDFRSLAKFGDTKRVVDFMQSNNPPLRHIVLLEDFVGSGTQIDEATRFAASLSDEIAVLLVPLLICPAGVERAKQLVSSLNNVRYEAVTEFTKDLFITPIPALGERALYSTLRQLSADEYLKVVGNNAEKPRPYHPLGFAETGALVVMYSNTPANTLPIIHHRSNTWRPLFQRSARIR